MPPFSPDLFAPQTLPDRTLGMEETEASPQPVQAHRGEKCALGRVIVRFSPADLGAVPGRRLPRARGPTPLQTYAILDEGQCVSAFLALRYLQEGTGQTVDLGLSFPASGKVFLAPETRHASSILIDFARNKPKMIELVPVTDQRKSKESSSHSPTRWLSTP